MILKQEFLEVDGNTSRYGLNIINFHMPLPKTYFLKMNLCS